MIAAGSAVLGFDACQSSGPPRPDPRAARPQAASRPPGLALKASKPVRVDIPRIGVHSRLLSLGLEVGVLPVGAAVWTDTAIDMSALPAHTLLTDALTGATMRVSSSKLELAHIFEHFPGAVLCFEG